MKQTPPECGCASHSVSRRRLIGTLGLVAGFEAVSAFLPADAMRALAAGETPRPEKSALIVGMIPTICALPLLVAQELGIFKEYGFDSVSFVQTGSPQLLSSQMQSGAFDLSQQYMPAPLIGGIKARPGDDVPVIVGILGQNGCSLAMALKHKDNRDPRNWRTLRFGVPFLQSHHALLLRYFLAEHGIDPDVQVSFRVVPPNEFVLQLKAGIIDGFFASEPNGQQAVYEGVGYIHTLSQEIWPGHPCCALTAQAAWIKRYPRTLIAFQKAVLEATRLASDANSRSQFVSILAQRDNLNQQQVVIEQVLSGQFADGLGDQKSVRLRTAFDPYPYPAAAIWMLSQLKRWGFVREDIKYAEVVSRGLLDGDIAKLMAELRMPAPSADRVETIMGRPFDPAKATEYIAAAKIHR